MVQIVPRTAPIPFPRTSRLATVATPTASTSSPAAPAPRRPADATPVETDLGGLIGILRRNFAKIVLASILGMMLAIGYLAVAKPVYTATASIFIDPRTRKVVSDELSQGDPTSALALVDSQLSIITSDAVLRRVVKALKLDEIEEYATPSGPGLLYKIKSLITPQPPPTKREPVDQAIQKLLETVKVKRAQKTYVADIEASASQPERARDVAQAVADAYLDDQRETKAAQAKEANKLVDGRLEELRHQVSIAEAAVDRFRKEKNILTSEGGIVTEQQLTRLNSELINVRAVAAESKARRDQILSALKSGSAGAEVIPDAVRSGLVQRLREQYSQVARREAALASQLQPKHPVLIEVRSQLAEVKAQITAELKRVATAAQADYEIASNREREISQQLERSKAEVAKTNTDQIRLRDLEQDATASRELLRIFLSRAKETQEQQNIAIADARIVTPPSVPPKPAKPVSWLILALGTLGGLGLGIAAALITDHFDKTLRDPRDFAPFAATRDVSEIVDLQQPNRWLPRWPALAAKSETTHAAQFSDLLAAIADYKDTSSRSRLVYRQSVLRLLNRLKTRQRPGQPTTIMLASPQLDVGNSATALALAYAAAMGGERVLLVDATSRDPALSTVFATSLAPQTHVVLDNKEDLARITTRDERTGLAFLPIALADLRALKVQQRRRLAAGLTALSQRYDLIFIDAGGMVGDPSASCLLPLVDQLLLVGRAGVTTKGDISQLIDTLEPSGVTAVGAVLTLTDRG